MHTDPRVANTTVHRHDNPSLEIAVRSLRSPTGEGREENQDNFLLIDEQGYARFLKEEQETWLQVPNWPRGHRRLVLLDGMGGHHYGRQAAESAVEGLIGLPAVSNRDQLCVELTQLHQRLYQEFQQAGMCTGCTLVLLEIPVDAPALLFHVGDSRLYSIDAQNIHCLTIDHVPATHLALLGALDSTEWLQQVHVETGSQISQAFILGSTLGAPNFYPDRIDEDLYELHDGNLPAFLHGLGDRRTLNLEPDRVYLLASDGLWHLRQPQAFIQRWPTLLIQPHRPLEELLDALLAELATTIRQQQRQPDDNCTVILVRRLTQVDALPHSN